MILFFFFLVADLRKERENYQIMIIEKKILIETNLNEMNLT
jgi:hypothetical protein